MRGFEKTQQGKRAQQIRLGCLLLGITLVIGTGCYRHGATPGITADRVRGGELVSIPGGTFTRGDLNGDPDEYPENRISLKAFRIERTEVNNAAYRGCVQMNICDPGAYRDDETYSEDEQPIVGVSWHDAKTYCEWIGRRLPTEAEWEYAARGNDLRKWPWRGAFRSAYANARGSADGFDRPAPVTAFPEGVSPFGLLNMSGNVAEWVADFYDPTYYRTSEETEGPRGPKNGRERTLRGGGFTDLAFSVRVTVRKPKRPTDVAATVGFRCAADVENSFVK